MAEREVDPVSRKTSEEALEFVRKIQQAFPKAPSTAKERAELQKYLARFTDEELKAVGRRVLSDLMGRPPRTIRAGDLPAEPPARTAARGPPPPQPPPPSGAKGSSAREVNIELSEQLLRRLLVHRIEDGGVAHLVDGALAPGHVARWLVRVPWVLRRVVPGRGELDPGGDGQRDRRAEPVKALPVEVPVRDVDQRGDGLVLHPGPDLHLAPEHVHVRMDGDQLHGPVHEGARLDLVAGIAGWDRQVEPADPHEVQALLHGPRRGFQP